MKVIISSKHLATELNKLDLDNYYVFQVVAHGSSLFIKTGSQSIELDCLIDFTDSTIEHEDVNWANIRNLVNMIEEQPITLQISNNKINIIVSY